MSELMSSVSSQIQRAINEQVLPQFQCTLKSGQGQIPNRRWKVPARRSGYRPEEALNRKFRSGLRDELPRDLKRNEDLEDTHYNRLCSSLCTIIVWTIIIVVAISIDPDVVRYILMKRKWRILQRTQPHAS